SPLFAYTHGSDSTTGCAIARGAFYNPPVQQFPSEYVGDYFFANLCSGWIRRFHPSSGTASGFATGISNPVDLKVSSSGTFFYLARGSSSNTGVVFEIRSTASLSPTIAVSRHSHASFPDIKLASSERSPNVLISSHTLSLLQSLAISRDRRPSKLRRNLHSPYDSSTVHS